jgi:phospholipid/cholesterol/gamma-HCH transport system substrate-binding protein
MADKSKVLTWAELRVGAVVIGSLAVLAFAILYIGSGGGSPFAPKYQVKALMSDVNGLKSGAPVRLGGVEVGTVTGVDFAPAGGGGLVEVVMRLDRRAAGKITTESEATLGSLGLLGEKAVDITPSGRGRPIRDGDYLASAAEDPFKGLLSDASDSTAHLRRILSRMDAGEGLIGKALRDAELYDRMLDVSMRLQNVMGKLESDKGPLGRMMNDEAVAGQLGASARSLEAILKRIDSGQGPLGALTKDEQFASELKSLTRNLGEISGRLARGEGSAGRLLKDEALFERLDGVSTRLDGLLARLERGEGSAGRLLQDAELYNNLSATLKELRSLVSDVRADPKRYLRVKVSLF